MTLKIETQKTKTQRESLRQLKDGRTLSINYSQMAA